jgi:cytochrome c oxidase assembly protein subunit 15
MFRWFRRVAAATTVLVFALILLGVYTAAVGAGLACSGQWPLCDGGLLPQSWPSAVEWTHRLVAAVTGVFILGVAAGGWRVRERAPRAARTALLALVLTPVQVLLGGGTVFIYTPGVQAAHHAVALGIFGSLLATTLYAYEAEPAAKGAALTE